MNSYVHPVAKRRYQLNKRAQDQSETRRRIVDATVALHREVGPASTTISAIAERAGVQRLTVYRHFPDNRQLFLACSERNTELNPPPDPSKWARVPEPAARLKSALTDLFAYYRRAEPTLRRVLPDARVMPELAEVLAPMQQYFDSLADLLVAAWEVPPERLRLLRAAILHSIRFETWSSLSELGLDDDEAVELLRRFVLASR